MILGDIRKMTAGLPDETKLEIRDESTDETYAICEIKSMAFEDCYTKNFGEETIFWLQFTTNIELQSEQYSKTDLESEE